MIRESFELRGMIGTPPFADNISRIYLNELDDSELVDLIQDTGYEKGDAYGFTVDETERDLLSGYLLLTRPVIQKVYTEETQSVEDREIQTVEKIPFRVDFKYGLLEVFADQNSSSNITNKLGQLTNWETTIENVNFSPQGVMNTIEDGYETELTSIKISNYSVTDSVVGDFSVDIDDQEVGERLLSDHTGKVSYLGVRVKTDVDSVTLGIYDSGSIVVYNEMEGLTEILDSIKESTMGGDHSA